MKLAISVKDVSGEKSYKHSFLSNKEDEIINYEKLDPFVKIAIAESGFADQELDEVKVKISLEV